MSNKIWTNVNLISMQENETPYGLIENTAMVIENDYITWIGSEESLPNHYDYEMEDAEGDYISPGLIDCHTHLIYGGNRIDEFEKRLNGVSYEEIAKSGGGILSTVQATRDATEAELIESANKRLSHLKAEGVTTIEVKSGYGLNTETELKMLSVARTMNVNNDIDVIATFLGAHAIPDEHKNNRDDYIDLIINEMLPKIAEQKMAAAVDGFCETIGFQYQEMEKIFIKAKELGLNVKLHAEQLSNQNGAKLAAKYGALSADHLEHLTEDAILNMKEAGTIAVLLPGAYYTLRDSKCPPIDLLRKHKVPMAVATDCNPGSSPVLSLKLMINMASTIFQLTPEEAIAGVTRNAAKALGLRDRGIIKEGMLADLVRWDIEHPAELAYYVGGNHVKSVIKNGKIVL
ncbi:imidazolonepropionase [Pseudemcibacter sp.]|jgi:imidazolonepropionase|uniref:imidazolonepropionase n=1 Tax=Pseudemcibacter sp. TaxID=2943293 RepID=UPI003F697C46|nr:imidazolonepropionase [Kordiimonadaceae bacterium]